MCVWRGALTRLGESKVEAGRHWQVCVLRRGIDKKGRKGTLTMELRGRAVGLKGSQGNYHPATRALVEGLG